MLHLLEIILFHLLQLENGHQLHPPIQYALKCESFSCAVPIRGELLYATRSILFLSRSQHLSIHRIPFLVYLLPCILSNYFHHIFLIVVQSYKCQFAHSLEYNSRRCHHICTQLLLEPVHNLQCRKLRFHNTLPPLSLHKSIITALWQCKMQHNPCHKRYLSWHHTDHTTNLQSLCIQADAYPEHSS